MHSLRPLAVIVSLGDDELRFLQPLRTGDQVTLKLGGIERGSTASKPDRGIVTLRLTLLDAGGTTPIRHLDTVLMRRRDG